MEGKLETICAITREELKIGEYYSPTCCIAATAILLDVLKYFDIGAKPYRAVATIFNPIMAARIDKGEEVPEDKQAWFNDGSGCWAIGIGFDDGKKEENKWNGHLVALTDEGHLCDLTLDQANRPHVDINLPTVLIANLGSALRQSGWVNGCLVSYELDPKDRTFKSSPDWKKVDRRRPIAGAAIRRIRRELCNGRDT